MQQYFAKNKNLDLEQSDYHHIKNVMRMKPGDLIKIVYDKVIYTCKLKNIENKITYDVIEKNIKEENTKKIAVAFSLIKEQKLNYLIQKGTEIGVDTFIPINAIRSVVKIDDKKKVSKKERWQKICKEASEQSFRNEVPVVGDISNIKDIINLDYDLKLICSLNKNTKNIKKVLQKNNKCDRILLVFGPEGGFDPKEEKILEENGFISVSLGDNVLRAETAVSVALSMIKYEFMR